VYPLDTVRTRLAVCHSTEYAGIWATAVRLWQKEGLTAFYRGLVPSMVRGLRHYSALTVAWVSVNHLLVYMWLCLALQ
jgi:solute carrier family 25 phosphate transporter 23/24/25/41